MESAGFSQSKAERVEAINLKIFSLQPLMPGLLQKPVPSVFSGLKASNNEYPSQQPCYFPWNLYAHFLKLGYAIYSSAWSQKLGTVPGRSLLKFDIYALESFTLLLAHL